MNEQKTTEHAVTYEYVRDNAVLHMPAQPGDVGYDAVATKTVTITPGWRYKMPLGVKLELGNRWFALIQAKSGRAVREGLTTIGNVIDSGYRGEIHAILVNTTTEDIVIKEGEKCAQIVFLPALRPKLELGTVESSERGESGFGSTGL